MSWHSAWTTSYWALGSYTSQNVIDNATEVYNKLTGAGWTHNAACGVIGNLIHESCGINPGQFQGGYNYSWSAGFGIAQWTPGTKVSDYIGSQAQGVVDNGNAQMNLLMSDTGQWNTAFLNPDGSSNYYSLSGLPYITSMSQYSHSSASVADLTAVWMVCWERPSAQYAGLSTKEKLNLLIPKLEDEKADKLLTSDLAEIAWLLNLRASDISYCPVFKAFMIIGKDGSMILFTDKKRFDKQISDYLSGLGVVVCAYELVYTALSRLSEGETLLVDTNSANATLYLSVNKKCKIIQRRSPLLLMKAQKNETELNNIRTPMVVDGVALERFFYWLEQQLAQSKPVTELDAAAKLLEFRQKGDKFISESFACISAFNQHAAMPHYAPDKTTNILIEKDGVYLVDSGGQYFTGTTDITRVIPTGKISDEFSTDYTLVLKAMVNISLAKFPNKTTGSAIDAIGRINMWKYGKDFGHGTGHGVGFCLNVHEGPVSISPGATKTQMLPGMVSSNEPGYYLEGKYGIRIENLVVVKPSEFEDFNCFETLTLCHIDTRPVNKALLSDEEIEFINNYNKRVFQTISPYLDGDEIDYLKSRTKDI